MNWIMDATSILANIIILGAIVLLGLAAMWVADDAAMDVVKRRLCNKLWTECLMHQADLMPRGSVAEIHIIADIQYSIAAIERGLPRHLAGTRSTWLKRPDEIAANG